MRKTIPWAMTWMMALMLLFSFNSRAQLFETDFGVSSNWTPDDSNTAYETRSYSEGVWSFTGESSIRDNVDTYNGSAHTFRNRGLFTVTNTDAVTGMTGFNLYIRDWSVTVDRVVQISTNGGTDFTTVATLNAGWFADQDNYFPLTFLLDAPVDLAANDFVLEISGAGDNTTRMRIGGFAALDETSLPYTELFSALPAYFGASTERGFAADANSVYVVSRNGGVSVQVHDRLTGALTGTLNTATGISGGTFPANDLEITEDGVILLGNLGIGDASAFKLYILDETNDPVEFVNYPLSELGGAPRLGDKFTVVGSIADGSAVIYAADATAPRMVKWSMVEDGVGGYEFSDAQVIDIEDPGDNPPLVRNTPVVAPLPDGSFYYTASGRPVSKHNADGTLIGSVSTDFAASSSTGMKYIGMEGADELLAIYQFGDENLRLARVVGGDPTNVTVDFITPSLGSEGNTNGTGDVAFVTNPDPVKSTGNVDLYVMGTNNGVGGYSTSGYSITYPVYEFIPPPVFARAQIIHNSADAAAASVDIFVNGELFYPALDYKAATPFVDVPAGVDLTVDIAPAGAGIDASVFTLTPVQFTEDETYVIVASGIVSDAGYDPLTDFSLELFAGARETADVAEEVDLLVYHGVTDAPGVNVDARYVGNLVTNAEYTNFAGYLNVGPNYYTLDIAANAAPDAVLASFGADLRALEGGAATVLATGFLDPSVNSDGEAFGLLAVLADGTVLELPAAVDYEYELSGLVEVPSNLSDGTGSGMLTLAGTVAQLSGSFSGLGSAYTMSHIHIAANGANGGVAHALTADLDVDELGGSYDPFVNTFDFSAENIDDLTAGGLYVNIHSTDFPAGEIRGQILMSPNTAPTASAITAPAEAAELTIEGDPATPFVPTWDAATDDDGDLVTYVWQLAADDAFTAILVNADTGTETEFATDFETVDAILDGAGVAVGESITVYHRAISTDGSAVTNGTGASVVLTRGEVAGFSVTEFPYVQDFEGEAFPPEGWSRNNVEGTIIWSRNIEQNNTPGGTASAFSNWLSSSTNNFLISPVIEANEEIRLNFYVRKNFTTPYPPDNLDIVVSTTDTDPASFTDVLETIDVANLQASEWINYRISLADYSDGSPFYLAFRHYQTNGNGVYIDDVIIEPAPTTFSVTFNVGDDLAAPITDAVVTFNGVENAAGDYVFTDIEPGTYNYSVLADGYDPFMGEVTVVDADVVEELTLETSIADLAAMPETLDLGFAVANTSSISGSVMVANDGFADAVIADGDIVIGGADAGLFAMELADPDLTYPITLGNEESFEIMVSFAPDAAAEASADITITYNSDDGSDLVIPLSGTGYDPYMSFFENFDMAEGSEIPSPFAGLLVKDPANTSAFTDLRTIGSPYSAPNHVRLAIGNSLETDALLVTPMVTNIENSWLRFYARMGLSSQTDDIEVGYMTDPMDVATFVVVDTLTIEGTYAQYAVDFSTATDITFPTNAYLAIRNAAGSTFRVNYIDDVAYEAVPTAAVFDTNIDEIDFGAETFINESSTQEIIIGNSGLGTITINETDIAITGADAAAFELVMPEDMVWPLELASLDSYTLTVQFNPTEAIAYTASLDIEDNIDAKALNSIPITGTGYDATITPDFVFDFNEEDFPPMDWRIFEGELTDDSMLEDGATHWNHDAFANVGDEDNAANYNIYSTRNNWLVTPPIDLGDGSMDYMLTFDVALTAWNSTSASEFADGQSFSVVVSTDGGLTWSDADVLNSWSEGQTFSNTGETINLDLSDYTGRVAIGFYAESNGNGDIDLFVDNVGVSEAMYYTVTFNVDDTEGNPIADATVMLGNEMLNAAPYEFTVVPNTYDYEVSSPDYISEMGSVSVADMDVVLDIVLEDAYMVDFTVTDGTDPVADAEIMIYDSEDMMVDMLMTDDMGLASIMLPPGDFTYDVTAFMFLPVEGAALSVVDMDISEDVVLSMPAPEVLPFTENFDAEVLPDNWFIIDGAANEADVTWQFIADDAGSTIDGTPFAFIDSDGAGNGTHVTAALMTPAIDASTLTGALFLSFDHYYRHIGSQTGAVDVWDGTEWVNIVTYDETQGSFDEPASTMFDITAHANAELRVRFHFDDADGWNWYWAVDNVTLEDLPLYTLTLEGNPADWGTVTGAGEYVAGAQVEVDAVANAGYEFINWTNADGDTISEVSANIITMPEEDLTLIANFALEAADAITMTNLIDATGDNLPAEIGTGGNARGAALYMGRYAVVASREGGPNVYAWDYLSPHLGVMTLPWDDEVIEPVTFPINYVRTAGDAIYVSNLSLNPAGDGWGQGVFKIYRWDGLDASPEAVISYTSEPGRLGDAFSIIGDPKADGHIIAHINGTNDFRVWNFEGGVIQNEDTPDLFTLDIAEGNINHHGIYNAIPGEDNLFVVTSNNQGIMLADLQGNIVAEIPTSVISPYTYDPNIFEYDGKRFLSYTINNEDSDDAEGARYEVVDISEGATLEEAFANINSSATLSNRTVYSKTLGAGHAAWTAINQVVIDENNEAKIFAHVVGTGFVLETTGAAPAAFTLTVDAQPDGVGTATGGGDYFEGAVVPVSAEVTDDAYEFVNWTVDGTEVSTEMMFDYIMPGAETTLTANFQEIPVTDIATLAELRDMPADGSRYRYTGEAVITAMDGFRNRKFLQDETAAIMIDDNAGIITTDYLLYDVITNVVGSINIFRDLVQFVPVEDPGDAIENTPIDPIDFALDEVTQDDQAKYIKFTNVTFVGVEPDSLFDNGTNYTVTDGTNEFVVRTDFWNTDLFETEIPTTPVIIRGVVITFFETLQLVPRFAADIEEYIEPTTYAVTFNVDMSTADGFDPEADVVYLTGDMFEWADPGNLPDDQTMSRVDDSMIWTKTLNLEAGTYEYKYFLNAGWDGGEWEGGDNRSVDVSEDIVLDDLWGSPVSVEDLSDYAINVYPNPARDHFNVTADSRIEAVIISDLTGKVVYNNVINDNQVRILNTFETGMYIMHIHTENGVAVRKLQIQK